MNRNLMILGVVLLVAGAAGAGYFISTGYGAHIRAYGSEGVAALGVILLIASVAMKPAGASSTTTTGQFKCAQCGATFGSDMALKSHMKDKHGM